jgi:hypothetical protein
MYLRQVTWKLTQLSWTQFARVSRATVNFAQGRQERKGPRRKKGNLITFAPFARWFLAPLREMKGRSQIAQPSQKGGAWTFRRLDERC